VCGLIDLDKLAQDGVRVRASAGATSYRRRATLEQHLARAHEVVEELKRAIAREDGRQRPYGRRRPGSQ
jgi:hypothetical protein